MSIPGTSVKVGDEKVFLLHHRTNTIHILGTNHIDPRYVRMVRRLIKRVNPQVVAVELCRIRAGYKNAIGNTPAVDPVDAGTVSSFERFDTIPKENLKWAINEKISLIYLYGAVRYLESKSFRASLHRYREMRTYKLGEKNATQAGDMRIGAELLAPFANLVWRRDSPDSNYLSNSMMGYRILLIDRPVDQTYEEIAEILEKNEREYIKIYKNDLVDVFSTPARINFIRGTGRRPPSFVTTLWSRKPVLRYLFIEKRNEYMATRLFDALRELKNAKLVCVVGKSHVEGIVDILQRKFRDSNKLKKFPNK